MKRILAVMDRDAIFAEELAACANLKGLTPYLVIAFEDPESLDNFIQHQPVDILLNGTDMDEGEIKKLKVGQVIKLSEGSRFKSHKGREDPAKKEAFSVCKYQACDSLFREVMSLLKSRDDMISDEGLKSQIIGVASCVARCQKTGFAITLGQILAESARVLYLNLEDCSGLSALTGTVYKSSLSDLIYAQRQGSITEGILGSATYKLGALDYIAPVSCGEDLEEIRAGELSELIERLAMEEHYEVMILDIGNLGRNIFPLLELCEIIYSPVKDDPVSEAKIAEWKEQLSGFGGEDLLGRVRLLHLPPVQGEECVEDHFNSLLYGEMGKMVRDLLSL